MPKNFLKLATKLKLELNLFPFLFCCLSGACFKVSVGVWSSYYFPRIEHVLMDLYSGFWWILVLSWITQLWLAKLRKWVLHEYLHFFSHKIKLKINFETQGYSLFHCYHFEALLIFCSIRKIVKIARFVKIKTIVCFWEIEDNDIARAH
jgi:hypothetical protein